MGKYMRKSKTVAAAAADEDAVMDITTSTKPQSPLTLGVRTRAKTLALSKFQHSYLQLRSRKLQRQSIQNPSSTSKTRASSSTTTSSSRLFGVSSKSKEREDDDGNQQIKNPQGGGNFEACIGENFAGSERSRRESTPCSLMKDLDTIGTPGSNTSASSPTEVSIRTLNSPRKLEPKASEVEEFFAGAEQQQHKQFIEKYNFDPVKEKPLPGRYGWVKTKDV